MVRELNMCRRMNAQSHVARCMSTADRGHQTSCIGCMLGQQPRGHGSIPSPRRTEGAERRPPAFLTFRSGRRRLIGVHHDPRDRRVWDHRDE